MLIRIFGDIYPVSDDAKTIKIGAQRYLRKFYESLGFISIDEFYMEDGIPHLYMIKGVNP